MTGDYSRRPTDPTQRRDGVYLQQGSVLTDADANELTDLFLRRHRSAGADMLGRAAVPNLTPTGFEIGHDGSGYTIGIGRMYVDGLQLDNVGLSPTTFDPVLDEVVDAAPLAWGDQAWPTAEPPSGTRHVVYVEAWQRERGAAADPSVLDPALYGIETSTRVETVWRVGSVAAPGADCSTPDDEILEYAELIQPAGGRLTTRATGSPAATDPCELPPLGGYRGVGNRLYRVEVFEGGDASAATFVWSRDNASTQIALTADAAVGDTVLSLVRTGRDDLSRLVVGDALEVRDDTLEGDRLAGHLCEITSVDHDTGEVTIDPPLPRAANRSGNARVVRWDSGPEPVAIGTAGDSHALEDGIEIEFGAGDYRVGDAWIFASRTADASVEELVEAPPRFGHRHFARLAIVDGPGAITDCRPLWPRPGTHGCGCTVCVTADSHRSGELTIQHAIDLVQPTGGTVCIGPGDFVIDEPLIVRNARGLTIRGTGHRTAIRAEGSAAMILQNTIEVNLEEFMVLADSTGTPTIGVDTSINLRLDRLVVISNLRTRIAVGVEGVCVGLSIERCLLIGRQSIAYAHVPEAANAADIHTVSGATGSGRRPLVMLGSRVRDNMCIGGIQLVGPALFVGTHRIEANEVIDFQTGGIAFGGLSLDGAAAADVKIRDNVVRTATSGIFSAVPGSHIVSNTVAGFGGEPSINRFGIGLVVGLGKPGSPLATDGEAVIADNTITNLPGMGILAISPAADIRIDGNHIEDAAVVGIGYLPVPPQLLTSAATLLLTYRSTNRRVRVTNNIIRGLRTLTSVPTSGVAVIGASNIHVTENEISDFEQQGGGLRIGVWFERGHDTVVSNNTIRSLHGSNSAGVLSWLSTGSISVASNRIIGDELAGPFVQARGIGLFAILGPWAQIIDPMWMLVFAISNAVAQNDSTFWMQLLGIPEGGPRVNLPLMAVQQNQIRGAATGPTVFVSASANLSFSDNQVKNLSAQPGPIATVQLTAESLQVSANHVETTGDVALNATCNEDRTTLLGNVAFGDIRLNNGAVPAPWTELNQTI